MRFSENIKRIFIEHFGGLIGSQLLAKQLIKYEIHDLDSLSDDTKRLFLSRIIKDCFGSMVDEERLKKIKEEFEQKAFQ